MKFKPCSSPPTKGITPVILLYEHGGKRHVCFAYYLNNYPLEREDCDCAEEHDDGCPTTGWFYDNSNFEYENCYYSVTGVPIAYALSPTVEEAEANMEGPW